MGSVLDEMNEKQRKILKQFRASLDDDLSAKHNDEILVKFLRAKHFNLKEARKIFFVQYYNKIITQTDHHILDYYVKPEVVEKYETFGILGYAKDGTLIRYAAAGRLDFYGFIMSMSVFDLCVYFSHMMEMDMKALRDQSLKTGNYVSEMTYIFDMEGFTVQQVLHKCVIETGLDFTKLVQECYPEMWRRVLVVNVPKIFHSAFGMFKVVMGSTILDKIYLADKGTTKDLLLKYIDEDVLPVFLGGNRVDSNGDPMCKEFIIFGGKVPEKLYSKHLRAPLTLEDPDVRLINVPARSSYNLVLQIKEAGSTIRLECSTENGSIYMTAFYKEFGPDSDNTELPGEFEHLDENSDNFQYKRICVELRGQMHCTQEDAVLFFPWPGIYIVRCGNYGSWFGSRKMYFKYKVNPPSSSKD